MAPRTAASRLVENDSTLIQVHTLIGKSGSISARSAVLRPLRRSGPGRLPNRLRCATRWLAPPAADSVDDLDRPVWRTHPDACPDGIRLRASLMLDEHVHDGVVEGSVGVHETHGGGGASPTGSWTTEPCCSSQGHGPGPGPSTAGSVARAKCCGAKPTPTPTGRGSPTPASASPRKVSFPKAIPGTACSGHVEDAVEDRCAGSSKASTRWC